MSLGNTIIEAVGQAIGKFVAYIIGKILGKSFGFEAEKAQKIGEYVVIVIIVPSIVVVTFKYS